MRLVAKNPHEFTAFSLIYSRRQYIITVAFGGSQSTIGLKFNKYIYILGDKITMSPDNDDVNQNQDERENVVGEELSDITLCYLTCPKDAANAFLGAVMVTDYRARPLYFSFVSPIRPTKIQRILYGSTLEEHVKVDVISKKLLKDMPVSPDVLFVDAQDLLAVHRITPIPAAVLTKSADDKDDPARLTTLKYDTGSNMNDQEVIGHVLASLESFVDLVEPFNRMREALKEAIKTPDA